MRSHSNNCTHKNNSPAVISPHSSSSSSSNDTIRMLIGLLTRSSSRRLGIDHLVPTGVDAIREFLDELRADEQFPLVVLVALHQPLLLLLTGGRRGPGGRRHKHLLHVLHLQSRASRKSLGQANKIALVVGLGEQIIMKRPTLMCLGIQIEFGLQRLGDPPTDCIPFPGFVRICCWPPRSG